MRESNFDLSALIPQGKVQIKCAGEATDVWTAHAITSTALNLCGDIYKRHSVLLPGKYSLPFRIDMTVRLDFPMLLLYIGCGHITFASPRQDNRRIEDIAKPTGKPNQDHYSYDNSLPPGEYTDISVTYNLDDMQICIGGEERFYSRRQAYMKAKNLRELNAEGFEIGLAVSKLSVLSINSITVTEFDGRAPVIRGGFEEVKPQAAVQEGRKPTFESVISGLPQSYIDEIIEMDRYLAALRPLKFRRVVDKSGGKITYVASDFGISYAVNASGAQSSHDFGWYIVYNGKPETWHRKADFMEEALTETANTDPKLSERIFYALSDCVACFGPGCLARTRYTYNGQKRLVCHGRVVLRMCPGDFHDAREFFRHLNTLMERKAAGGNMPSEKILLMKARDSSAL